MTSSPQVTTVVAASAVALVFGIAPAAIAPLASAQEQAALDATSATAAAEVVAAEEMDAATRANALAAARAATWEPVPVDAPSPVWLADHEPGIHARLLGVHARIAEAEAARLAEEQAAAEAAAAEAAADAAAAAAAAAPPPPPPPPPTKPQPPADSRPRHERVGQEALARVRHIDIRGLGWRVEFHPGRSGYLGLADWETQIVHVWVRDSHSVDHVLATLAHEMVHVLDYEVWTPKLRQKWLDLRGLDVEWYPPCSCNDRAYGAGDIAEAAVILEAGAGHWTGHYGRPTQAQLDWLRSIL